MDAFLLAAGLGTRLRPLTEKIPKPLVEVLGRPLIDRNLESLKKIGCNRVIINTHYLADQIYDYVGDGSKWGLEVLYSYEEKLLDTGGGLKNVFDFISTDKFLTWNADVLIDSSFSNDDSGFKTLLKISQQNEKPLITLLVKEAGELEVKNYGELMVDKDQNLIGFLGRIFREPDKNSKKVIFCGISIMDKRVHAYFPSDMPIFSLTRDIFPQILSDKSLGEEARIKVSYCNCYWNDIGTPESLNAASYNLK